VPLHRLLLVMVIAVPRDFGASSDRKWAHSSGSSAAIESTSWMRRAPLCAANAGAEGTRIVLAAAVNRGRPVPRISSSYIGPSNVSESLVSATWERDSDHHGKSALFLPWGLVPTGTSRPGRLLLMRSSYLQQYPKRECFCLGPGLFR